MSSYTKSTDFASKDALLTGNPLKVVKGTEIDDEFNAIQTAVNSKADINSPDLTGTPTAPTASTATNTTQIASTAFVQNNKVSPAFTGTPTAPTASFGTDTTQLATTAFVQAALEALYPVGTIFTSTSGTNPASTFGFGTWEAFGSGRVLVGQDSGDSSFNTLEETGGSKDTTLPSHTHTFSDSFTTASAGSHNHTATASPHDHVMHGQGTTSGKYLARSTTQRYSGGGGDLFGGQSSPDTGMRTGDTTVSVSIASNGVHAHTGSVSGTTSSAGSSATNANLQPYIVVKMWKRTA